MRLDPAAGVSARDVELDLPAGISLDAPPVQTADHQVFWRLRADAPGDHVLAVQVGDAVFEKGWAVGGEARKVPLIEITDDLPRSWKTVTEGRYADYPRWGEH